LLMIPDIAPGDPPAGPRRTGGQVHRRFA
jgi:hypothetical protein